MNAEARLAWSADTLGSRPTGSSACGRKCPCGYPGCYPCSFNNL